RHGARTHRLVLGMARQHDVVATPGRIVGQYHLQRPQHTHGARRRAVEVLAQTEFEHANVDGAVGLGNAGHLDEVADRRRRTAAAAHVVQGRHARVNLAVYQTLFDQLAQRALAHQRVVDVQARELDLLRVAGYVELV